MTVEVVRGSEVVEGWITGISRDWRGEFTTDDASRYVEGDYLTLQMADGRRGEIMVRAVSDGANGVTVAFGSNGPLARPVRG